MTIRANTIFVILAAMGAAAAWLPPAVADQTPPRRVTVDNFRRAESDMYFARFVSDGAFDAFKHNRELASVDNQTVIRLNRDTLYSFGVFDLEAGTVTVTLPDTADRYVSMQVVNQDHFTPDVVYAPAEYTLTRERIGTRYVCLVIRTFVDADDPSDLEEVHAVQDAIEVEQEAGGTFEVPEWDRASQDQLREALLAVVAANGGLDSARMFGREDQVDPVHHLLGTAAGWGGNPPHAAVYVGVEPEHNDGDTPYRLDLEDVPVDGFWSVSVYNEDGFFEKNPKNAYSVNNISATPNADGSVTIHFGGDEDAPNYLPITPGWNYLVRMYRPRQQVLDRTWTLPEAQPVK